MRKGQDGNGYSSGFADLHNRLYGKVFSFVRLRINDQEEVKDIVQDVFLKAYNSWQNMSEIPDETTAKNFLFIIARQRMIDIWRSARSRFQVDLPEVDESDFDDLVGDQPLPEELFEKNENREIVLGLLNQIKKEEREILLLRFIEEMEYTELAKIYKTSEDNIRQKVSRSLQNLRKVVKK